MTSDRKNEALKLDYLDPMTILTVPGALGEAMKHFGPDLSPNDWKKLVEETVQAAAWCSGMAQLWKRAVAFSPGERRGADSVVAIAGRAEPGQIGYLQLKQLPPLSRSSITLQDLIGGLVNKYNDPESLYLGIAVNRPGEIDFASLVIPPELKNQILELWVFGRRAGPEWFFCGDLLVGGDGGPGR